MYLIPPSVGVGRERSGRLLRTGKAAQGVSDPAQRATSGVHVERFGIRSAPLGRTLAGGLPGALEVTYPVGDKALKGPCEATVLGTRTLMKLKILSRRGRAPS